MSRSRRILAQIVAWRGWRRCRQCLRWWFASATDRQRYRDTLAFWRQLDDLTLARNMALFRDARTLEELLGDDPAMWLSATALLAMDRALGRQSPWLNPLTVALTEDYLSGVGSLASLRGIFRGQLNPADDSWRNELGLQSRVIAHCLRSQSMRVGLAAHSEACADIELWYVWALAAQAEPVVQGDARQRVWALLVESSAKFGLSQLRPTRGGVTVRSNEPLSAADREATEAMRSEQRAKPLTIRIERIMAKKPNVALELVVLALRSGDLGPRLAGLPLESLLLTMLTSQDRTAELTQICSALWWTTQLVSWASDATCTGETLRWGISMLERQLCCFDGPCGSLGFSVAWRAEFEQGLSRIERELAIVG